MEKKPDKTKNNKKIIITVVIIIAVILLVLLSLFVLNKRREELKTSIVRLPLVTYKASDLNLLQNLNSEITFDGKFTTYGNKKYYYKWMVYRNGVKSEESAICTPIHNGLTDRRTMKISSQFNYGKWAIYSDPNCKYQSMVYFTLTYTAKEPVPQAKTFKINYKKNTAQSIGKTSDKCVVEPGKDYCYVTIPKITPKSGYKVEGWDITPFGTNVFAHEGDRLKLEKDITLYAITKKNDSSNSGSSGSSILPKRFTVTFNKNGASAIGATSLGCTTRGDNCNITLPSITAPSGYDVIGWNVKPEGGGPEEYDQGTVLNINRSFNLYAIVRQKASIRMNRIATHEWNVGTSARLVVNVTPSTDTYQVYSSDPNVIHYKNGSIYGVGPGKATITVVSSSGAKDSMSFTVKGNSSSGGGSSSSGTSDVNNPKRVPNATALKIRGINVYIEKGCSSKSATANVNRMKYDLNHIPNKMLNTVSTVYIMTHNTFHKKVNKGRGYDDSVLGLSWPDPRGNYIDVVCDKDFTELLPHELGHAFDHAYKHKYGTRLSSQQEYRKFVSQHINDKGTRGWVKKAENQPVEFFADNYADYYLRKVAPTSRYNESSFMKRGVKYDLGLMIKYVDRWK